MGANEGGRSGVCIFIGVISLLVLLGVNVSGERNSSTKLSEEEVRLLRERVAQLENRLGATLVNNGRGSTSSAGSTGRTTRTTSTARPTWTPTSARRWSLA